METKESKGLSMTEAYSLRYERLTNLELSIKTLDHMRRKNG